MLRFTTVEEEGRKWEEVHEPRPNVVFFELFRHLSPDSGVSGATMERYL
jgi:hypothetical protein